MLQTNQVLAGRSKRKPLKQAVVHTRDSFAIKSSPGRGRGLFAKVDIKRGDTIGHYTGEPIRDWHASREPHWSSLYLMWICKNHWINAVGPKANYTRYINHSANPNSELVISTRWKTARIRSRRTIRPGDEIFYDYGDEYWQVLGVDPVVEGNDDPARETKTQSA